MTQVNEHRITILLCNEDFEQSVGRRPKNQNEFRQWAAFVEKGLFGGHIDWQILWECACDAINEVI